MEARKKVTPIIHLMKRLLYENFYLYSYGYNKPALFSQNAEANMNETSAYDFTFQKLHDEDMLPLKQFKGQVLLIVNTESHCGFTPQYNDLEKLYTTYKDQGLVVIGVPSNDFGSQEPGTSEEIAKFCEINYGVTFPMTEKEVVSGDNAHPFYKWAKQVLGFGTAPKWNFHKYLVDRHGNLIDYFNSTTSPDSKSIKQAIEKALADK